MNHQPATLRSRSVNRNRRDFLKTAALGAVGLTLAPALSYAQENLATRPDKRPNIVLILADDMTWDDMGCMGSPCAITPNLDRIAAQGVVFDRLYTCTSVCTPTRFQLNTGRMPAFGKIYGNNLNGLKNETQDYAKLPLTFQSSGYLIASVGKHLFDTPPDERIKYEVFSKNQEQIRQIPIDFIREKHDRPFLLYVGSTTPHVVWGRNWPFPGPITYDPARLKLPGYAPDTPAIRRVLAEYYQDVSRLDETVGMIFDAVQASPYAGNTLFLFMTEQGSQIPRGKGTCHEIGIRATMIAHWPGKIEAGRRSSALLHYVDIMPTLLELVGAPAAEDIDGKSFLPVLMGESDEFRDEVYGAMGSDRSVGTRKWKYIWNGPNPAKTRMGVYLKPLKEGKPLQGPEGASRQSEDYFLSLLEAETAGSKDPRVALILDSIRNPSDEELYDIENDVYELNNLLKSDNPPNEVLADMRRRLADWLEQQNDQLADDYKTFLAQGDSF